MHAWKNECMNAWVNATNEWMQERIHEWMFEMRWTKWMEWMNEWTKWVDEWTNCMNEMNEWMNEVLNERMKWMKWTNELMKYNTTGIIKALPDLLHYMHDFHLWSGDRGREPIFWKAKCIINSRLQSNIVTG